MLPSVLLRTIYEVPPALAELGPYFEVSTHDQREAPAKPWLSLAELLGEDGELFAARIDAVRAALARAGGQRAETVDRRAAVSIAQMGLVSRLISPVIGLSAVAGLGVRWEPSRVRWQAVLGGPYPLSLPTNSLVDGSDRRIFELLDGPVRRLVELAQAQSVSGQVLWGNVASAVNSAATMVAKARPACASNAWDIRSVFLEYKHLKGTYSGTGGQFQRRSCCLLYRIASTPESGYCGDCIHLRSSSSPPR